MKRVNLLILSEQNNPDWMSGPLLGFHQSCALAKIHNVTIVTHARNLAALASRDAGFRDVVAVDLPLVDKFYSWMVKHIFKGDHGNQKLTALRIPYYLRFEAVAWRMLKRRILNREFDAVLRLTPVSPILPSLFASRLRSSRTPFVIGPLNGGLPWPGEVSTKGKGSWLQKIRRVCLKSSFFGSTYHSATAVVAGSSWTFQELKDLSDHVFLLPENGVSREMIVPREPRAIDEPLRLIFIGRLVDFKRCDLAIKGAVPFLRSGRATLCIVGDGPERGRLQRLCDSLGVSKSVKFLGMMPHAAAMAELRQADVMVFPSVREFGGGVVFEALASGVPPIVVDYGGPSDIVREGVGFKLAIARSDQLTSQITNVVEHLLNDSALLLTTSVQAQLYAAEALTWDAKAAALTRILLWCLGG
jgi:glycosyltransferase involved in cell wall biosynthesis